MRFFMTLYLFLAWVVTLRPLLQFEISFSVSVSWIIPKFIKPTSSLLTTFSKKIEGSWNWFDFQWLISTLVDFWQVIFFFWNLEAIVGEWSFGDSDCVCLEELWGAHLFCLFRFFLWIYVQKHDFYIKHMFTQKPVQAGRKNGHYDEMLQVDY